MHLRSTSFRRRTAPVAALAALWVCSFGASAQALTINPATSNLDLACGGGDPACFFNILYDLDSPQPLTGTFDITAGVLNFSVNLASATLSVVGGPDGGVTSVDFTGVTYSGSVAVVDEGSGQFSVTDQAASVSGTLTPTGAGAPVVFDLSGINTTGLCNDSPGLSLTCGLTIGAGTGFAIDVNGNTRYFRHTIDFKSVVPEPNTALLLGVGLAAIGRRKRRSRSPRVTA